jgi:hypothetical protein
MYEGDLPGIPKTGNRLEMTAIVIYQMPTANSWRSGPIKMCSGFSFRSQ